MGIGLHLARDAVGFEEVAAARNLGAVNELITPTVIAAAQKNHRVIMSVFDNNCPVGGRL